MVTTYTTQFIHAQAHMHTRSVYYTYMSLTSHLPKNNWEGAKLGSMRVRGGDGVKIHVHGGGVSDTLILNFCLKFNGVGICQGGECPLPPLK